MNIVNCTPHPVNLILTNKSNIKIDPSGLCPRVSIERKTLGYLPLGDGSIPLKATKVGKLSISLQKEDNTVYIVSRAVAEHSSIRGRSDVVIVDETVRDENGKIIGACALAQIGI